MKLILGFLESYYGPAENIFKMMMVSKTFMRQIMKIYEESSPMKNKGAKDLV